MNKLMFVRMNVVEAIPMTRKEYVESRGWELPANENPDDQVYKVVYADGYVSMCPKDKFDAVSIPCAEGCVPFGYAITECVYHGKRITRKGLERRGAVRPLRGGLRVPFRKDSRELERGRWRSQQVPRLPLQEPSHGRNRHSGRLARVAGRHEGE